MKNCLKGVLTFHPLLTLLLMLLSAATFGLLSYNLFFFLKNNIALVAEYGLQALYDGAFEELLWIFLYGTLSLLSYLIFKACEKILVEWIVK